MLIFAAMPPGHKAGDCNTAEASPADCSGGDTALRSRRPDGHDASSHAASKPGVLLMLNPSATKHHYCKTPVMVLLNQA